MIIYILYLIDTSAPGKEPVVKYYQKLDNLIQWLKDNGYTEDEGAKYTGNPEFIGMWELNLETNRKMIAIIKTSHIQDTEA